MVRSLTWQSIIGPFSFLSLSFGRGFAKKSKGFSLVFSVFSLLLSLDDSDWSHSIFLVAPSPSVRPSSLSVRRLSHSVFSLQRITSSLSLHFISGDVFFVDPSSLRISLLWQSVSLLARSVSSLSASSSNPIRERFRFHFLSEASLPPVLGERVLHFQRLLADVSLPECKRLSLNQISIIRFGFW